MQADSVIQNVFTVLKNIRWRDCESNNQLEWYYAESTHYVIHDKETNAYWFIKAKSPTTACDIALKRLKNDVL